MCGDFFLPPSLYKLPSTQEVIVLLEKIAQRPLSPHTQERIKRIEDVRYAPYTLQRKFKKPSHSLSAQGDHP